MRLLLFTGVEGGKVAHSLQDYRKGATPNDSDGGDVQHYTASLQPGNADSCGTRLKPPQRSPNPVTPNLLVTTVAARQRIWYKR